MISSRDVGSSRHVGSIEIAHLHPSREQGLVQTRGGAQTSVSPCVSPRAAARRSATSARCLISILPLHRTVDRSVALLAAAQCASMARAALAVVVSVFAIVPAVHAQLRSAPALRTAFLNRHLHISIENLFHLPARTRPSREHDPCTPSRGKQRKQNPISNTWRATLSSPRSRWAHKAGPCTAPSMEAGQKSAPCSSREQREPSPRAASRPPSSSYIHMCSPF